MKVKDISMATTEQYDFINSKYPKNFLLFGKLHRKHHSIYNDIDEDEVLDKVINFMCLMDLVIRLSLYMMLIIFSVNILKISALSDIMLIKPELIN